MTTRRGAVGRRLRLALALGLAVTAVTSCASETERYCSELDEQQENLTDLAVGAEEPGEDFYPDLLAIWQDLRAEAPGDLAGEWDTLVFSLEAFLDAVERTGASADDFDPDNPPEGATDAQVKAARDAAADLASPRVLTAAEQVQQHARDVCKADLGITGRGG